MCVVEAQGFPPSSLGSFGGDGERGVVDNEGGDENAIREVRKRWMSDWVD